MNKDKLIESIDTIALISLSIGVLFYINNNIFPKSLYFFALTTILMLPSVLYNIQRNINKKSIGFIIFFLYLLLCLLISYSVDSMEYIIYYFVGLIYLLYFSKRKKSIEKLLKYYYIGTIIFTFFTVFSVLYGLLYLKIINFLYGGTEAYSIIVNLFSWHEYSGIAGQTGYNAFIIAIGIIISFIKIIDSYKSNNTINKKVFIVLLLQIAVLFLCSKRALILYTFTTILFLLPLCVNLKKKSTISKLFLILIVLLLIGCFSINFFEPLGNVFAKNSYYINKGNLLNGRLPLYSQAISLFKKNILFGIGIKTFHLLNNLNLDVHNVYLQLLAENGIIGFIIMFSSFSYMFFKTKKNLKTIKYDMLTCISLGIQMLFLLYALSGNTLYDVNMLYLYFIVGSLNIYSKGDYSEK